MPWEIAGAAVLGVAMIWLVAQPLVRPGVARAPVYVPPDEDETRRGVALAALREIEFDRETGKLSDKDYAYLKAKYTAEAIAALRADGEDDAGAAAERLVAARGRAITDATANCRTCGPRPQPDAIFCSSCGERVDSGRRCESCDAIVPIDARFCERCGVAAAA